MTGFGEAIRAELDDWLDDFCGAWRDGCPLGDHDVAIKMRAAIIATLDVHAPQSAGVPNKPYLMDCSACLDVGPEVCEHSGYPCDTVEAIAKQLGMESQDARP